MAWGRMLLAAALTLLTTTCIGFGAAMVTVPEVTTSFIPASAPGLSSADDAAAREPYNALIVGNFDQLAADMAPSDQHAAALDQLGKMRALAPSAEPLSSRLTNWTQSFTTAGRSLRTVHEYTYSDRMVRVTTSLTRTDSGWRAVGFNLRAISVKEAEANKFSLAGHSPRYTAFLAATLVIPLFMLGTALAALFWPNLKMRPVWIFPIFVGIGMFRMNGATEAIAFQPLSIQLFGASALWSGSAFDPWVFGLSIPLAAIVFWILRAIALVRTGLSGVG